MGTSGASSTIPRNALTVLVSGTPQRTAVRSGYIGFSMETSLVRVYFGLGSTSVNPMFVEARPSA